MSFQNEANLWDSEIVMRQIRSSAINLSSYKLPVENVEKNVLAGEKYCIYVLFERIQENLWWVLVSWSIINIFHL